MKHRHWITLHLGLSSGELPMRYLGLLLQSKRLSATECEPLTQAITSRLQSWKVRFLSYAGRVELIRSVLSSMHLYWTSVFVLLASVLHAIDRLLPHFLWYGYGHWKLVYKSWKDVACPKQEGGLGIRSPGDSNKAGVLRLLWEVETIREALWVKWVCSKYLRGSSI